MINFKLKRNTKKDIRISVVFVQKINNSNVKNNFTKSLYDNILNNTLFSIQDNTRLDTWFKIRHDLKKLNGINKKV